MLAICLPQPHQVDLSATLLDNYRAAIDQTINLEQDPDDLRHVEHVALRHIAMGIRDDYLD
jgi:hypothetical protein